MDVQLVISLYDFIKTKNTTPEEIKELCDKIISNKNDENIQYATTKQEFANFLRNGMKYKTDFDVKKEHICEHMYKGTVCSASFTNCNYIHIRRCKFNNKCKNKNCTYLHNSSMPDKESKEKFISTMKEYNELMEPKMRVNKG